MGWDVEMRRFAALFALRAGFSCLCFSRVRDCRNVFALADSRSLQQPPCALHAHALSYHNHNHRHH